MNMRKVSLFWGLLMVSLGNHALAADASAFSVQGTLDSHFAIGELRYCHYLRGDMSFYVVQKKENPCQAEAIGEFLEPKRVKKPSLKIPRLWKEVR
jgi:hypothetical protein